MRRWRSGGGRAHSAGVDCVRRRLLVGTVVPDCVVMSELTEGRMVLDWPKIYKLARAFRWEDSYEDDADDADADDVVVVGWSWSKAQS